jgi:hypothetical protein
VQACVDVFNTGTVTHASADQAGYPASGRYMPSRQVNTLPPASHGFDPQREVNAPIVPYYCQIAGMRVKAWLQDNVYA